MNGRHEGETVFITGAGPQLAKLSREEVRALERSITIGVNLTQYVVRPTYFLSAYLEHVELARHRSPDSVLIHMRPEYAPPLRPYILAMKRHQFEPGEKLPDALDPAEPTLFTRFNVILGATHLAYVMGAARIVYVGVEQRNAVHFYSVDARLRDQIRADLDLLPPHHGDATDHPYFIHDRLKDRLSQSNETLSARPFYQDDHTPTFAAYFKQLREDGLEICTTTADSVIRDAGGTPTDLSAMLAGRSGTGLSRFFRRRRFA